MKRVLPFFLIIFSSNLLANWEVLPSLNKNTKIFNYTKRKGVKLSLKSVSDPSLRPIKTLDEYEKVLKKKLKTLKVINITNWKIKEKERIDEEGLKGFVVLGNYKNKDLRTVFFSEFYFSYNGKQYVTLLTQKERVDISRKEFLKEVLKMMKESQ